jgi:hypothetical protein
MLPRELITVCLQVGYMMTYMLSLLKDCSGVHLYMYRVPLCNCCVRDACHFLWWFLPLGGRICINSDVIDLAIEFGAQILMHLFSRDMIRELSRNYFVDFISFTGNS